ncbi:MAG TPA: Cthe_2314 family HEPN domain-containing protein [Sphingobacteriaceae bacterium]|nr:Cthe_2314 family HEPN domain-containing protein [Sphingobacteriaceae bacterium]
MTNLDKIIAHNFIQSLLTDSEVISKGRKFKLSDIELENPDFTEYEYYIHNTGFYCIHFLELCRQLENAIELLSNFRYDGKYSISRGDHLTYNIENYIIRLASLSDRTLQTINATFHLGIDEKDVNERVIINNLKVSRTTLSKHYNEFKKSLKDYTGERNTIVHRHSFMDKQLKKIQIFYHSELTKGMLADREKADGFKEVRKRLLTEFISDRKKEFQKTNETCFKSLLPILDDLDGQYRKMKQKLK